MITFLALLLGLIIGYVVGHDVALYSVNNRMNELRPMIDTLKQAAEELNKPPQLPPEAVRQIFHEERGGRVQ